MAYVSQPRTYVLKHVFQTKTAKVSTNADIELAVTQNSKDIQSNDNYKKY